MTSAKEQQLLNKIDQLKLELIKQKAENKQLLEKLENIKVVDLYNLSNKK